MSLAVVTVLHSFHPPTTVYSALRTQLARPHQDTHLPTTICSPPHTLSPTYTPTNPPPCAPPPRTQRARTHTPARPPPCSPRRKLNVHPPTAMLSTPRTQLARINTPARPPSCSPPRKLNVHPPTAMFSTPRTQLARELRETRERYTALELVVQTKDTELKRIREQLDAATREVCVYVCQCLCLCTTAVCKRATACIMSVTSSLIR